MRLTSSSLQGEFLSISEWPVKPLLGFGAVVLWLLFTLVAVSQPASADSYQYRPIDTYSPEPQHCTPLDVGAKLYIFDGNGLRPITPLIADIPNSGFFDISGYLTMDQDGNGRLEAYAVGTPRTSAGGGHTFASLFDRLEIKEAEFGETLSSGVWLGNGRLKPSVLVKLQDWSCRSNIDANGEVSSSN